MRRLKGDLDWITMKALEKDRNRRYGTASDLATDIDRHLNHEPVSARPPSGGYILKKFVRKNRGLVTSLAVIILALASSVIAVTAALRNEGEARRLAESRREEAERERTRAQDAEEREREERKKADEASTLAQDAQKEADQARSVAQESLDEILRLSNIKKLSELRDQADLLWPAYPSRVEAMEAWLVFGLEELVDPDPQVGLIADVDERLFFARTVREETVERYDVEWEEAIASIANEEECPDYQALQMKPQIGLVPIGRDPESGLWEFGHLQTGKIPNRDDAGNLEMTEKTGLVFVLIPGGTFRMGSQKAEKENPNYDPQCKRSEGPVHEVTLVPFFLSKYEMTQGQWKRFTKKNPSYYGAKTLRKKTERDLHPVEQVSWADCDLVQRPESSDPPKVE